MTGVFDVSPIAEEAICLAMMVMVITGAQFCSIMITETPVELLNAIQLILSRKSSSSSPNKKRLSVMIKSENALNIKIFLYILDNRERSRYTIRRIIICIIEASYQLNSYEK